MLLIKTLFFKYLRILFWITFCVLFWFLSDENPYNEFEFFKTNLFIIIVPIIAFLITYFVKSIKLILWLWLVLLVLLVYLYSQRYII